MFNVGINDHLRNHTVKYSYSPTGMYMYMYR